MERLRTLLIVDLFRDPPVARRPATRTVVLVAVVFAASAIALQLGRIGWTSATNVVWAEDGHIFLQEAMLSGFFHAIFATYATYLVLAPRLIGELVTLVPMRDAAVAFSVLSAATVALCGAIVWFAAAAHIRNPVLRLTLVALTVLPPFAGIESIDSSAYVLWYMAFATFWVLLWRPRAWWSTAGACAFVAVTALSTPAVWFFALPAALRAVAARGRRDLAILVTYGVTAAIQVPVVISSNEVEPAAKFDHHVWTATFQRLFAEAPLGLHLAGNGWKIFGWPLLIVIIALGVWGLVTGMRRTDAHGRLLAGIAVATGIAMFIVELWQRAAAAEMAWSGGTYNYLGSRYVIVPALLLVSAALVLVDERRGEAAERSGGEPSSGEWRLPGRAATATVAVLAIALVSSFWLRDLGLRGVPWKPAVEAAQAECAANPAGSVSIQTAPPAPGWEVELPCSKLPSS
jgi:hypothetical protein